MFDFLIKILSLLTGVQFIFLAGVLNLIITDLVKVQFCLIPITNGVIVERIFLCLSHHKEHYNCTLKGFSF